MNWEEADSIAVVSFFLHFGDKQAEPRHTLKAQAAFNGYWIYRSSVLWDKCQFLSRKENPRITSRCPCAGQNLGSVMGGGAPEMPTENSAFSILAATVVELL